jgi:AcrR family transcriptional regulator
VNTDRMKASILSTAMQLANLHGFGKVTRNMIADRMEIATGSVSYHWKDMRKLAAAMVERAVETGNLKILGQAIAAKHPVALRAPDDLRKAAVLAIAGL